MTRVTATEARRRLFHLLDAVERGEQVIVERRGVRYHLSLEDDPKFLAKKPRAKVTIAPELLESDWTWITEKDGELELRLSPVVEDR